MSTRTSTIASVLTGVCVKCLSARLGSVDPDGWLCARITPAALTAKAFLTTSRGYTDVLAHSTATHLVDGDQSVLRIQKHHGEHLVLDGTQLHRQKSFTASGGKSEALRAASRMLPPTEN